MVCEEINVSITDTETIGVSVEDSETIAISLNESNITGSFLELTDTPNSYSGKENYLVKVNSAGTGLEFNASSAIVNWGGIVGTLSNQTDLQDVLNLKYNSISFNTDWDSRLTTKSTTNLSEGTNLYYTEARVSLNSDVSANTSARHNAVTVNDSTTVNFTLIGQSITADVQTLGIHNFKNDKVYLSEDELTYIWKNPSTGNIELWKDGGIIVEW